MPVRNHNREMEGNVASQQKLFSHSVLQRPLSEVKSMKCYGQIHTSVYICILTRWDCGGDKLHFQIVFHEIVAAIPDGDGATW